MKEVDEKSIFWLEIDFWVSRMRTLAPSRVDFRALSSAYTYNRWSICPDSEYDYGSSFSLLVRFDLLMVDLADFKI